MWRSSSISPSKKSWRGRRARRRRRACAPGGLRDRGGTAPFAAAHHGRAALEAVEDVHVALVVHLPLKEELAHLEERRLREKRVGARLVLGADALDLEVLRQLVEAALEALARLHQ